MKTILLKLIFYHIKGKIKKIQGDFVKPSIYFIEFLKGFWAKY